MILTNENTSAPARALSSPQRAVESMNPDEDRKSAGAPLNDLTFNLKPTQVVGGSSEEKNSIFSADFHSKSKSEESKSPKQASDQFAASETLPKVDAQPRYT